MQNTFHIAKIAIMYFRVGKRLQLESWKTHEKLNPKFGKFMLHMYVGLGMGTRPCVMDHTVVHAP